MVDRMAGGFDDLVVDESAPHCVTVAEVMADPYG
jgi:hypothetical protein